MRKDRIGHKISNLESYLFYNKHKYCKKCVKKFIEYYGSIPNDGSLQGGLLAKDLADWNISTRKLLIN